MSKIFVDYDKGRRKGIIVTEHLPSIREYFSVEDDTQKFKRRFTVGYRPQSRVYAITPQGRFEPRLITEILSYTHQHFNITTIEYSKSFLEANSYPKLSGSSISELNKPLRDYQQESVELALKAGSGVIVLPTSAGKTLVMATLITNIQNQLASNYKTLVLVPDIQLVEQSYSDLIEYGIDPCNITRWTGDHSPNKSAAIIIANSQILLSEKQDTSLLQQVQLLVIDEVHKLKASNKISKVVATIPAKMRYGLTGTMPDAKLDRWYIIGQLGPVLYQKKSIDLRNQNYISNVQVVVLQMNYYNPPHIEASTSANPTAAYELENEFLQTNLFRNKTIQTLVQSLSRNTLVLVDRIAHGELLLEILKTCTGKDVHFICGDVDIEERERVRNLMENNDNIICVAISKIFSTGVNIRNLHYIIFASIGKAKTKIIQSIGRSLRLHASKKKATIFDIGDNMRYGNNHLRERMALYKSESIPYTIKIITQTHE